MKTITMITILMLLALGGCGSLRFAPGQQQKQNAWLHNKTAAAAARVAAAEQASARLQELTDLSERQSTAFVASYGLPDKLPEAERIEDILSEESYDLADAATQQAYHRPDPWKVADNVFELAIGLAAVVGGVYGTKAVSFLRDARQKSQALKEVVEGNELFKKDNGEMAQAFKQSHRSQSPATRQLVTKIKT